jgi:hypothetical protein
MSGSCRCNKKRGKKDGDVHGMLSHAVGNVPIGDTGTGKLPFLDRGRSLTDLNVSA